MTHRCPYIKKYIDTVFGPYLKELNESTLIETLQEFVPSIETNDLICQLPKLNCSYLLTYKNLVKWCNTTFYGPDCLESKLNSSGIEPPTTTTPSPKTLQTLTSST
ncbi:Hypothetical protein SRAE_X000016400 [Strongyloides ratti]|uniref:Uncharacterized protein n=1 Tax=Strongyloides ratti TaxID=34506 RepID=A0A090LT99_STRRB|nr:Hypothetical protein SRAE_X000016400 [Strongyloides ratti]CEF70834.1 Hypothetical protein SRAE_X000016400 [Strongyloides ratti]